MLPLMIQKLRALLLTTSTAVTVLAQPMAATPGVRMLNTGTHVAKVTSSPFSAGSESPAIGEPCTVVHSLSTLGS